MSKKRKYRQPPQPASEATRRYITWMRLTHNGRRTPTYPACSECGSKMTGATSPPTTGPQLPPVPRRIQESDGNLGPRSVPPQQDQPAPQMHPTAIATEGHPLVAPQQVLGCLPAATHHRPPPGHLGPQGSLTDLGDGDPGLQSSPRRSSGRYTFTFTETSSRVAAWGGAGDSRGRP